MKQILRIALCSTLLAASFTAFSQGYPTKPVRFVLTYPPGGGTDLIGRPIAEKLTERLRQQVIIDNRGGANGVIGMDLVAHAPPDGYTMVMALTAQAAINPSFYPHLPYDPIRDYAPITLLGMAPYMLVVNPSVPAKTIQELIALAKSEPGKLSFASSGTGGIPHLAFEMLDGMAGIKMIHVPYKGGGPALVAVLGGQVQMQISTISPLLPLVKAGRLRAIAVTSTKRSHNMPDVPAIAESLPGYEATTFYAMLAPAHTPKAIVVRLNQEFRQVLADPAIRNKLLSYDFEPIGSSPEELTKYLRGEIARWAKVVKASGVKPD